MEINAARNRRPLLEVPGSVILGSTARPRLPEYAAPDKVRGPADLPARLYFGDLDPESFAWTDEGWTACYGTPGATGVRLTWSGSLLLEASFEGSSVMVCAATHQGVQRSLLAGAIDQFMPGLKRLADRHGALFAPPPDGAYFFAGFPEGPLGTLLVPIHPLQVTDAVDWFYGTIVPARVTVFGAALRYFDRTHYRMGGAADVPRDIDLAPQQVLQEGALAAFVSIHPEVKGADFVIDRVLYGLELHAPFRDMDVILSTLAEAGLSRHPDAPPEWRPVILPTVIAAKEVERPIRTVSTVDRQTTSVLPPSEWMNRLQEAHPVLRDAATEVATSIGVAWAKEVALLRRHAPDLARVESPEPPFRFIAFR